MQKLICIILIFLVMGCEKASHRKVSITKTLRNKTAALARKKKIDDMQKVEEMWLKEFNKDVEILKKRDPFSPSAVVAVKEGPAFNLGGIIWDEQRPAAIIDDVIVSEGDMVGDKKVKKITEDSVILIEDGKEYILKLKF